jgi:hypothetical protein
LQRFDRDDVGAPVNDLLATARIEFILRTHLAWIWDGHGVGNDSYTKCVKMVTQHDGLGAYD